MIFWQEVHYEVLQDIKRLMKLHSLVQRVAMSSQQFFLNFKHGEWCRDCMCTDNV